MTEVSVKESDDPAEIVEENEDWHDREAEIYDRIRSELWNFYEQRRITNDVAKIRDFSPGKHAVDIGSGTGNLVLKFAELGWRVEAVDVSENMIEVMKAKVSSEEESRINFHHAPADDFLDNLRERPGTVCFSSVLHHLPNYYETLETAIEKLPPGGLVYIVHEPLPAKLEREESRLRYLDKLFTPRASFRKWQGPEKESEKVDYHIDRNDGIELSELKEFFRDRGMTIVEESKYTTWKSGVLSGFDDVLELTERTDFKIIVRKGTD